MLPWKRFDLKDSKIKYWVSYFSSWEISFTEHSATQILFIKAWDM